MSAVVSSRGRSDLRPAFAATRAQLGLIALLLGLAVVAWWSTADRMSGMDAGPGTELGALGWFLGVWVVMMAAMMFPSVSPTIALYAQMARRRAPTAPLIFAAGYLVAWAAAGLVAYGLFDLGRSLFGDRLTWSGAGQWVAGGTLIVAGAYQLTPVKDACLARCRSPLGLLVGSWRDGLPGAFSMGTRNGAWCAGCCWALMASLFALGVMSLAWMAFVAALIALEKLLPWGRAVTYGIAGLLIVVGVMLIAAPDAIPGLTVPGHGGSMDGMGGMGGAAGMHMQ
jgi:predicted metal-binding membrane protein